MAYEVDLETLQKEVDITTEKILSEYFNKKNINLKTQIDAPSEFTTLDTIVKYFNKLINFGDKQKHKFKETPKTLEWWMSKFKEYMISNKRMSRHEVGEIIKAMKEQQNQSRSLLDRLTGMNKG